MPALTQKAVALAAGLAAALLAAQVAPGLAAQNPKGGETLVLDEGTVDWIEKSNVAALTEGVIKKMELQIGMPVGKDKPIGYLYAEKAELTVAKAKFGAKVQGPRAKAQAQKDLALSVLATNRMLNERGKGYVSREEILKAEAELNMAVAMITEAEEKTKLDEADLKLAEQALDEHTIRAPFAGVVIERMKNPGESVRANEAVVKLGNLDKLRVYSYIPLEYSYRVKEGQVVDFQPRLATDRNRPAHAEPFVVRGKISFVDPQIQPVAESAKRIYAEFENRDRRLEPGLKGTLTIYLNTETPAAVEARRPGPEVGR